MKQYLVTGRLRVDLAIAAELEELRDQRVGNCDAHSHTLDHYGDRLGSLRPELLLADHEVVRKSLDQLAIPSFQDKSDPLQQLCLPLRRLQAGVTAPMPKFAKFDPQIEPGRYGGALPSFDEPFVRVGSAVVGAQEHVQIITHLLFAESKLTAKPGSSLWRHFGRRGLHFTVLSSADDENAIREIVIVQ
jgi:hypothetical protein